MGTKNKFPLKVQGMIIVKDKLIEPNFIDLFFKEKPIEIKLSREQIEAILNYKKI